MHLNTRYVEVEVSTADEFDSMIYVIDPSLTYYDQYKEQYCYEGYWFKYLGNGEYEVNKRIGDAYQNGLLNIKDAKDIQRLLVAY